MSKVHRISVPVIGRAILTLVFTAMLSSCAIHTCTGEGKFHDCKACMEEMHNMKGMHYMDASTRASRMAKRHGYEPLK